MRTFNLMFTGDFFDAEGKAIVDLALDRLASAPYVQWGFIEDQKPPRNDPTYYDNLYSMEITPDQIATCNGIVVCRPWLKASAFAAGANNLVAVGRAGIGYDKLDLLACTAHDVIVFNSPDGLTHSTASAALVLMLALARRLPMLQRMVRDYRWDLQNHAIGDELDAKTLGIVGLGQTGMELARLVAPFSMQVIAYSPHADPAKAHSLGVTLVDTLDELLQKSDFISLHCRLNEQTRGMIGHRELSLMKPTSFFINVARGEMVDQSALVRCLEEGRIAGAGSRRLRDRATASGRSLGRPGKRDPHAPLAREHPPIGSRNHDRCDRRDAACGARGTAHERSQSRSDRPSEASETNFVVAERHLEFRCKPRAIDHHYCQRDSTIVISWLNAADTDGLDGSRLELVRTRKRLAALFPWSPLCLVIPDHFLGRSIKPPIDDKALDVPRSHTVSGNKA